LQTRIKERLARSIGVEPKNIFIGNGSDEAIDLLFRIFCRPGADNCLVCPPTYGMYEVSARINDTFVKRAALTADFRLDPAAVKNAIDENTKLLFICSPNNPTGNSFDGADILKLAESFSGILVLDEAYIHFSRERSLVAEIANRPNLVVLQTFSKAWGLAGLRVGLAFASKEIIGLFNKVKPPYNVSQIAQEAILKALKNAKKVEEMIARIISQREKLVESLSEFSFVRKIYPSDANFVLVKTSNANAIYQFLLGEKVVVRNRSTVELCEGCLRITVGTPEENKRLLKAFGKLATSKVQSAKRKMQNSHRARQ
jgi:histidinol-phosphate aminotransferase